jgi:hypothetical protein
MFAVTTMAAVGAFTVMAITTADQAQATGTKGAKPYKFYVKLPNGNKPIGQVVKVTLKLFDNSGKTVASASKLATI